MKNPDSAMEETRIGGTIPFMEQPNEKHIEMATAYENRFQELTGQQIMRFCDSGSAESFAERVKNLPDSQALDALQDWLARKLTLAERELAIETERSRGSISVSYTNEVKQWQQRLEVVEKILRERNSQM